MWFCIPRGLSLEVQWFWNLLLSSLLLPQLEKNKSIHYPIKSSKRLPYIHKNPKIEQIYAFPRYESRQTSKTSQFFKMRISTGRSRFLKRESSVWNSAEKQNFRVQCCRFDLLLLSAKFQTEFLKLFALKMLQFIGNNNIRRLGVPFGDQLRPTERFVVMSMSRSKYHLV